MSGIIQAMNKLGRREFLNWCDKGYNYISELDTTYSEWLCIPRSIKTTSVKPSGCRPWYALTSTDQGILTLEELFEDHPEDQQWSDMKKSIHAYQDGGKSRISRTYNNGVEKVYRVRMGYGLGVESTGNHQWFVQGKMGENRTVRGKSTRFAEFPGGGVWKRTDKLELGDVLQVSLGVYNNHEHTKLERVNSLALKMRGDAVDILQPACMNPDLAWMLGYLWGDGTMSPGGYRLRWVDANVNNLEKVVRILEDQFGLHASIKKASQHRKAHTVEVGSKILWHWLIRNNIFKYYADRLDMIPKAVRSSSKEDILAFVAGLTDADGWAGLMDAKSGKAKFMISTSDAQFAQHLQDVCWSVGICIGRSHNTKGKNKQSRKNMYLMTSGVHMDPTSFEMFVSHSEKLTSVMGLPDFQKWQWETAKRGLRAGKVISVEEIGYMPTYDIEVENTHWYYAGAVKSHNTVSLLPGATPGIHYPHSEFYIRNIRVANSSSLVEAARKAGYKVEPDSYADNTSVVSFPVQEKDYKKDKYDASIWEQFANASDMQCHWADNAVSITISFKPKEKGQIQTALEHFETQLKSVSLLPLSDHKYVQAPYIKITEDVYHEMMKHVTVLDLSSAVHEKDDEFCDGDSCTLPVFQTENS